MWKTKMLKVIGYKDNKINQDIGTQYHVSNNTIQSLSYNNKFQ